MSTIGKEAGHTPGPWRVACGSWGVFGGESGGWIEADRPSGTYRKLDDGSFEEIFTPGQQICSFSFKGDGKTNARLIAAAPDLFAACEEMVLHVNASQVPAEVIDAMRLALSRAKGEA